MKNRSSPAVENDGRLGTPEHADDEALARAYQGGDVAAFEQLFSRYQHRVYGYFARQLGDRDLAEDLFQQTFAKVHRARHAYDPTRSFRAWLFSIAANLVKDELKRRTRRPGDARWDALAPQGHESGTVDPEQLLASEEQRRIVAAALATLPDRQREVIVLHKLQGLSFPEIADALGEQVEAVKARAFRGYRALRRQLDGVRLAK